MQNERYILKAYREIAQKHGYKLSTFCQKWIIKITNGKKIFFCYGYLFMNNNSSTNNICRDKCATSEIISSAGIPAVPHNLIMYPQKAEDYNIKIDALKILSDYLFQHGQMVVKDNQGRGGKDVYLIKNQQMLKEKVMQIFSKEKDISYCPYYDAENEYRVIMLNGKAKLIFKKERSFVIGDGTSTIAQLIKKNGFVGLEIDEDIDTMQVLENNKKQLLNWKFNLKYGAKPVDVTDMALHNQLSQFACKCCKALSVDFVSVDIIEVKNKFYLLEVNAGITLEKYSAQSEQNFNKVKRIYEEALLNYFKE